MKRQPLSKWDIALVVGVLLACALMCLAVARVM